MSSVIVHYFSYHKRGCISLDPVIFELYSSHCNSAVEATDNIKRFCSELAQDKKKRLSEKARHFILSEICRPDLVKKVFKTDGTLQIGLDV
jgi:hypothetical protein